MGAWGLNPLPSPGSRSRKDFSFSCIKGGAFILSSVHRSFIHLSQTLKGKIFFPGYGCYSYFPLLFPSSPLLPLLSSSFLLSFLFSFFTNWSPFKSLKIDLHILLSIQPVKSGTGIDTGHMEIGEVSPPCPSASTTPPKELFSWLYSQQSATLPNAQASEPRWMPPCPHPFWPNCCPCLWSPLSYSFPPRSLSRACFCFTWRCFHFTTFPSEP